MSILYVFFLNIIFVFYVRSDLPPDVICVRFGSNDKIQRNTNVTVDDIPDRCKVSIIGRHFFNTDVSSEDNDAIADLRLNGKSVYMIYQCREGYNWEKIISDYLVLESFIFKMLCYLTSNDIEGVILSDLNINSGAIEFYEAKINSFIDIIKQCIPTIKIGLHLDGSDSHLFNDKQKFDFAQTNSTVDFYVVDLWKVGPDCIQGLNQFGGRQPITSNDPTVLTLEKISQNITNSNLDKSKLVAYIYDLATQQDSSKHSYSDYCSRTGDQVVWCADTSQILYDRVTFLKNNNFKGLIIQYLDLDDVNNTCGCDKFPVANTFFDAWEGKPLKSCPALS